LRKIFALRKHSLFIAVLAPASVRRTNAELRRIEDWRSMLFDTCDVRLA
jgi:hypothetical protein